MRVSAFSKELPAESVIDKVQDLLSAFVADVEASRKAR
jgi:hypothetical protein